MTLRSSPHRYGPSRPTSLGLGPGHSPHARQRPGHGLGARARAGRRHPAHPCRAWRAGGVLTLFRILWWVAFDRHPEPAQGMSRTQEALARVVHLGLYAAILVMVASASAWWRSPARRPPSSGAARCPISRRCRPISSMASSAKCSGAGPGPCGCRALAPVRAARRAHRADGRARLRNLFHPQRRLVHPVLVQGQRCRPALGEGEADLRIDDAVEEAGGAFGEDFEALLAGQLGEEAALSVVIESTTAGARR